MTENRMARSNACVPCRTSVAVSRPELEGSRICPNCDLTWRLDDPSADHEADWAQHYFENPAIMQSHESHLSGMRAIVSRIELA